ncbi:MAG TPA: hypothetical protein VJ725_00505 [Thermoanaerobaculia bacterium]|nr:hypothetical protein [Thermoanaerobaculia bacterium]
MNPTSLLQWLQGPFNFLRPDPEEIRHVIPDLQKTLPLPRPVFLEDESATPIQGFPILLSEGMESLKAALRQYVETEEAVQVAVFRRETLDRRMHAQAWDKYLALLSRAVENSTLSSYGRQYPAVFWLQHSLDLARLLKETPKRVLRQDTEIGRRHGDEIKYRVLDRLMDRVLTTTYDLVQKVAGATDEAEEELFPRLLTRMRDNVLLFTEDHISPDLSELTSYFNGSLRIDGRDLRRRLDELARWHTDQLATDRELKSVVNHILRSDPRHDSRDLLIRPGYTAYLSTLKSYNPVRLLPPVLVQVWESLLVKLKEFELVHALRRRLIPIEPRNGQLISRDPAGRGAAGAEIRLSSATRPMDFLEPWVVDPRVERFGMIYDISDFSQTLSVLHRAGNESQDDAFRLMFRFQRWVNRLALTHRVKMEKYLGDGAFYSSREAKNLLVCSVHIQRYYVRSVQEGLPFDRGMRIALNYGAYRLIPMGSGRTGEPERYEFFGPGLVELSRLTTGKATQEIDEVKTMLVAQGYPEATVHKFFAPLSHKNVDVVDKQEEARRFYAYINRNGTLHNNGMIATGPYISQLEHELGQGKRLFRGSDGERSYVVLDLEDAGERLSVGVRKLGLAHLKGLEKLAVYEIVDGASLDLGTLLEIRGERLVNAVEREFAGALGRT